jgi:hypothetical protein
MKIYILLLDTGTLFTKAIKLYTKVPFNHASISFTEDLEEVYSFGRKVPKNPFIGGFVKERVEYDFFQNARCAVYSCTVTKEAFERMRNKVKEIESNKDMYRYNLLGVFAIAVNKNVQRKNAFFCSQFVAMILKEAGLHFDNKPLHFVTPSDIQKCSKLKLEYKGILKNYSKFNKNIDIEYAIQSQ